MHAAIGQHVDFVHLDLEGALKMLVPSWVTLRELPRGQEDGCPGSASPAVVNVANGFDPMGAPPDAPMPLPSMPQCANCQTAMFWALR